MATFTAIFSPVGGSTAGSTTADLTGSVGAGASSAEIVLSKYQLFAINATGDINIRFGNIGMPAAAVTDFRLPGNSISVYQLGTTYDRIRLFNNGASPVTWWIQPLSRGV